jgi:hypothetical protein
MPPARIGAIKLNGRARAVALVLAVTAASVAPLAAARIVLYEQEDFRGPRIVLDDAARNFDNTRFNDRARSMVITGEVWELCSDARFRGDCRTFGPGRYRDIPDIAGRVSSARPVQGGRPGGGRPGDGPAGGYGRSDLVLFSGSDLDGERLVVDRALADLDRTRFNDRAWSISVRGGAWELCTDAHFSGNCRVFPPGDHRLQDMAANVSSARPVGGVGPGPGPGYRPPVTGGRGALTLFSGDDLNGEYLTLDGPVDNLDRTPFNDRARSVAVRLGTWELCTDAFFRGDCEVFRPGDHRLRGGLGGRVSSARPVGR